jgi:asparagine synthetase B (glutamine-hydrolysing)
VPLPPLDPLEIHTGVLFGPSRGASPSPQIGPLGSPRQVLGEILGDALSSPPCHVLFSGGRDSSVVLAAATHVARVRGLPLPIPLTATFRDHPQTWETEWQERTIRHLRLRDWTRSELTTELDALGPVTTAALLRRGLFSPANAVSMAVFGRAAGAGTVLTGGGGDELFSRWYWRRPELATLWRLRPPRRALKWAGFQALPLRVRQRLYVRRDPVRLPWLRPEAEADLNARMVAEEPAGATWRADVDDLIGSRYLECLHAAMETFAADAGVRLVEPFYDPRFMRSVAAAAPPDGFRSRTEALQRLFGDLLPDDVLRRGTKALFTTTAWGPCARAFVGSWNGQGLDEALVNVDRVQAEWSREAPDGRSVTMLHHAWLAAHAGQVADSTASS